MDRKSLSIGNVQKLALLALLLVICVGSPAQVYNFNYLNSSLRKVREFNKQVQNYEMFL